MIMFFPRSYLPVFAPLACLPSLLIFLPASTLPPVPVFGRLRVCLPLSTSFVVSVKVILPHLMFLTSSSIPLRLTFSLPQPLTLLLLALPQFPSYSLQTTRVLFPALPLVFRHPLRPLMLFSRCSAFQLTRERPLSLSLVNPPPRGLPPYAFTYAGTALSLAASHRYLGLTYHCRSSLTTCIPSLASSATRRLRLLRYRCTHLRLTDARLLHSLYRTCVPPTLSWGAPLWTPFVITSLDDPGEAAPLETIFRSFLRWLLCVRRTCPLEILYHETCSLPQFLRL